MYLKEIVVATQSEAKKEHVRSIIEPFGFSCRKLNPEEMVFRIINNESVHIPAEEKAAMYGKITQGLVMAIDIQLVLDNLPANEQPHSLLRERGGGRVPSDEKIFGNFAETIGKYGGRIHGTWKMDVSLSGNLSKYGNATFSFSRQFTTPPPVILIPEYPLESLEYDPDTRKHLSEMLPEERARHWSIGMGMVFREFFRKVKIL